MPRRGSGNRTAHTEPWTSPRRRGSRGIHRQGNACESACARMGLSLRLVLGWLLTERLLRQLLDLSHRASTQNRCPRLGVKRLRQLPQSDEKGNFSEV